MLTKIKQLLCRHCKQHQHCCGIDGDLQNVILFKFCFCCGRSQFCEIPVNKMTINDLRNNLD